MKTPRGLKHRDGMEIVHVGIRIVSVVLGLLMLMYLNTAIVYSEGGPGVRLVIRPFHGTTPRYGGGEEGQWERTNPGRPLPWWMTGDYVELVYFSNETTVPKPVLAYILGYFTTVAGVPMWAAYMVIRRWRSVLSPHDRAIRADNQP